MTSSPTREAVEATATLLEEANGFTLLEKSKGIAAMLRDLLARAEAAEAMGVPGEIAAERAAAAEQMREACAEACDGHAETLALNAIGGLAVVAARTSAAIIRSLPIPSASALAERDERMREDGRREAFEEAARIADKERGDFAGMLQPETAYGAMCVRNAIRARSEGKP